MSNQFTLTHDFDLGSFYAHGFDPKPSYAAFAYDLKQQVTRAKGASCFTATRQDAALNAAGHFVVAESLCIPVTLIRLFQKSSIAWASTITFAPPFTDPKDSADPFLIEKPPDDALKWAKYLLAGYLAECNTSLIEDIGRKINYGAALGDYAKAFIISGHAHARLGVPQTENFSVFRNLLKEVNGLIKPNATVLSDAAKWLLKYPQLSNPAPYRETIYQNLLTQIWTMAAPNAIEAA